MVGDLALVLAKNKNIDKKALRIAGWVHDIGYVVNPKKHAEYSLKILERYFIIDHVLRYCILNHSTEAKPKTEEGKIFQLADKLYLLNPEIVSFLVKYKKKLSREEIAFFENNFKKILKLLKNYKFM